MRTLRSSLQASKARDKGAAMVEFGIAVGLIAVTSVMVIGVLGADVVNAFSRGESHVESEAGLLALAA